MVTDASVVLSKVRSNAGGWLRTPAWDLTFVSLSAGLVVIPYAVYQLLITTGIAASTSAAFADFMVTLLVAGPHMYATFTRTVADPMFRAHHRRIIATSLALPILVFAVGLTAFPVLLMLFFFWASVHVLHQIAFLVECYYRRDSRMPTWLERGIDYAVICTSLYPIAVYRLVRGTFTISNVTLPFPAFLRHDWVIWLAFATFAITLTLFLTKTAREIAQGRAHWPRLLLIILTVVVAFLLPGLDRLDSAFQGFNAWHSLQYLGLTWYANQLAYVRRQEAMPEQRHTGMPDVWRFYGGMMLCTLASGVVLGIFLLLREPLGLLPEQPYYLAILPVLLIHYYHDHVLFTQPEAIIAEAAPV